MFTWGFFPGADVYQMLPSRGRHLPEASGKRQTFVRHLLGRCLPDASIQWHQDALLRQMFTICFLPEKGVHKMLPTRGSCSPGASVQRQTLVWPFLGRCLPDTSIQRHQDALLRQTLTRLFLPEADVHQAVSSRGRRSPGCFFQRQMLTRLFLPEADAHQAVSSSGRCSSGYFF